tara:strand:+ start:935 stop:1396 length:462 start_codon:yes stop_codon:yes gene_type:complete
MTRRVLLGKGGSDYGLFISKIGVDVINDSGTLCDKDLMIFDSRAKGYAQLIEKGSLTIPRNTHADRGDSATADNSVTKTFSSIAIPNPVVIIYTGGKHVELTAISDFAFTVQVPDEYPSMQSLGYSIEGHANYTATNTPAQTVIQYIVLRGFA